MIPRRADAWIATGVALGVRLGIVAWACRRFPPVEDGHYYDVLARRVASGAGYTWLWPDGAVTYAAHYPVGYPALLAAAYALFGPSTVAAMTLNAVIGAAAAYGAYVLIDEPDVVRWRPLGGALAVAAHPALVPYTAAVMTEGVTASLLVVAAALATKARTAARPAEILAAAGLAAALATLLRPQSLVLAPVFGFFAGAPTAAMRQRLARAGALTGIVLACVSPWTVRNCVRMHRCALVSVNGGWNLLIGATTTTGGWMPLTVPAPCATVWDEAKKDACFEHWALREIGKAPAAWLARAPSKIAMTLDYFGAAPWYLHSSNPEAFDDRAKVALAGVETLACRLFLLGSLVACGRATGRFLTARKLVALAGSFAALTAHAWMGYAAVVLCTTMLGWRSLVSGPPLFFWTAASIVSTAVVHAIFFGAGRYGLLVAPFVAASAFAGYAPDVRPAPAWVRGGVKKPNARARGSGERADVAL